MPKSCSLAEAEIFPQYDTTDHLHLLFFPFGVDTVTNND